MELIALLIVLFFGGLVLRAVSSTASATARTVAGKGSFTENMDLAFRGMGALEARLKTSVLGEDGQGPSFKEVEIRGLFPVSRKTSLCSVASVFDATDGEYKPVISLLDAFQEPDSVVYQHATEIGQVGSDQGFGEWVRVAAVLPEALQTPFGGRRKLAVVLRLLDSENAPSIQHGLHDRTEGILWQHVLEFEHDFVDKGYEEAVEHSDESKAIAIQIAMAVAMSDGSLDDAEGEALRRWIVRAIAPYSDDRKKSLKSTYNDAMRDAHSRAQTGDLSLSVLTERLNDIGERSVKYEAIELCFDVMAADGVADAAELQVIRQVAEALDLDFDEIEKIRDQRLVSLDTSVGDRASVEDLVGIDPNWELDRIKRHLREEFQKWNNRLGALPEGEERENAQRMLDLIASARRKYD